MVLSNMFIMRRIIFLFVSVTLAIVSFAQKDLSLEQAVLGQWSEFRPKSLTAFSWRPNSTEYTYLRNDTLLGVDAKSNSFRKICSLDEVNGLLETLGAKRIRRFYPLWVDNKTIRIRNSSRFVFIDVENKNLVAQFQIPEGSENHEFSSDLRWMSYTVGQNLFLVDAKGNQIAVTNDSIDGLVNGQSVHRNEFGITKGTFWSPSGRYLAYYHMDESMVTRYPLVDITKRVAEVDYIRYPMAGMKSHEVTLRVYDTQSGKTVELKTGEPKEQYLTNVAWSPDERSIYIAVLNRGQNHLKFNRYNTQSGNFEQTLFEETSDKYVEPLNPPLFIDNNTFLWQSRRDGWNHIYIYKTDGSLVKQLTKGEWEVISINGVDKKNKVVYITATKQSPIEKQVYGVRIKNGSIKQLTFDSGTHRGYFSSDYKYFIDFYSSITVPNRVTLFNTRGKSLKLLLDASNPYEGYNVPLPKLVTLKSDDGVTLYGRIIKPTNFDSTKKYPVVVYVYGGPHSQLVTNSWMGGSRLWESYLANKGYILFTLDNRGTINRGAEFEQVIHRQLGVQELKDQLVGVKYLKSLPYVDSKRIGVHGWSFGGFMTITMMLKASDVFKVGVAGGPVTDWKFYEVMYGERYMDTPQENPEGYKNADLKNYVSNLKGKFLIIHDDMDNTVVPQHSLTLLHSFVKAGVQVDFFMYPQHQHNVRGKDRVHLIDKVIRYFEDYL